MKLNKNLIVKNDDPPTFLITIDTEGDNLWAKPRRITTKNAEFIPRFQDLCESNGFKPTYLTNFEMAQSSFFVEYGKNILNRNAGEIGMHLHAWNSPPQLSLTVDDFKFHPYLIEYPEHIMDLKIKEMTNLLEDTFQVKMLSHRAGRWSFNEAYAKLLVKYGYCVDCSVTPLVSWHNTIGDPNQSGGTDFSKFPSDAYFINLNNIMQAGDSPLLEVPMTIMSFKQPIASVLTRALAGKSVVCRALNHFFPPVLWLRPKNRNLKWMLWIVKEAISLKLEYIEFMLHSSELMPGGSPNFSTERDIDLLYEDMEQLFEVIKNSGFIGRSLSDYYQLVRPNSKQ